MPTRPPASAARPADPGDWFLATQWRRSVFPLDLPRARAERPILVLGSDSPLSAALVEALRVEGRPVILALAGDTFLRGGPDWFVVRPGEASDLEALVDALHAERRVPSDVLHLWTLAPDAPDADLAARYAAARDRGYTGTVALARALVRRGLGPRVCVHVLTNGVHEVAGEGALAPLAALALGPCRAAAKEFPGLRMRSLDLHLPSEPGRFGPEAVRRLLAELVAEAPDDLVAFRGRERLVGCVERLRLAERPGGASWLRERGVYLVVGGFAGVGRALAEHLARRARARLALLGRHPLPPREDWGAWLAKHGELEASARRIRHVQALEALGSEVLPVCAELADPAALRAAVAQVRAGFGALHGVFFAAPGNDLRALASGSEEGADRLLGPKVLGALALDAALEGAQPDFVLLHAPLAGALGAAGQSEAAAADAFLASFAALRSAQGNPTLCVAFGRWREDGLAAERERALAAAERAQPGRPLPHPVLRRALGPVNGEEVLLGALSADTDWWLAEHRTRDGAALLPAAALLELAHAAHAALAGEGPVELRGLRLREPLGLDPGERCALRVRIARASGDFAIESRDAGRAGGAWALHAEGRLLPAAGSAPQRALAEIRARCGVQRLRLEGPPPHPHLAFGPRFACLRAVGYGDGELLAELALPEAFEREVEAHALHVALVETAIGGAVALLGEYNPVRDFYRASGCARVRVWRPLPARLVCHVRHRRLPDGRRGAAFDATFLDEEGRELAALEELVFAKGAPPSAAREAGGLGAADASESDAGALHAAEGLAAIERLLAHEPPAHLLVMPDPTGAAPARAPAAPPPPERGERALWELASAGLESAA